jgi:alkaline phosphatase
MGGGRQFFFPNETYTQNRSNRQCFRKDGRKLVETWVEDKKTKKATHKYVTNTAELQDALREKPEYLLGENFFH